MLKSRLRHPGSARDVLYCVCQTGKPAAMRESMRIIERMPIDQPMAAQGAEPGKVHIVAPTASARGPVPAAVVLNESPVVEDEPCACAEGNITEEIAEAGECQTEAEEKSCPCSSEREASTYSPLFAPPRYAPSIDPFGEGLLYYQKYWFLSDIDISVRGEMISGTPMGLHDNTLRLINKEYSYYIPLRQVDYIRTTDGLESSFRKESLFDSEGAGCGVRKGRDR